jgi:AcrR family transcriptional regulator
VATTRAERRAQTRERLIEVATHMFLAEGYAATSLDKVAVEAGFSKGAVYSNFSGKDELCLAVLDQIHARQLEGVVEALSGAGDIDERLASFVEWARRGLGRPRATALEAEFAAIARSSEYVAGELAKRHRALTTTVASMIQHVLAESGLRLTVPPRDAALTVLSLALGFSALRSLDSSLDVEVLRGALLRLLGSVTERAG